MTTRDNSNDCSGCTLVGRREFLRDAALAAAALAALGSTANALPVSLMHALSVTDEQATYPLPASDGVFIDKKQEVIVARVGNQVFAFELACPHQNTALRWNDKAHEFQCPKHHSRYKPDGTFIDGRATRNMDRFAVTKQGNSL
ncbi:MAG TPA: Rieske (2Fe-2S) protein, partial [Gemmatimonadaceae bacterium]|nr:Rieske (2Fe-2S) protein [Gemmatimonadaceae bacterium]